jgi:hypothetical protein
MSDILYSNRLLYRDHENYSFLKYLQEFKISKKNKKFECWLWRKQSETKAVIKNKNIFLQQIERVHFFIKKVLNY